MPHTEYTGIVLELEQILTLVERKVTVPLGRGCWNSPGGENIEIWNDVFGMTHVTFSHAQDTQDEFWGLLVIASGTQGEEVILALWKPEAGES